MEEIVKTIARIKSFLTSEEGLEVAEYAVAAALVVAIAVVVYTVLGDAIVDENNGTGAKIEAATWAPPS
jgi:Flp pilus assembly pilin Flp